MSASIPAAEPGGDKATLETRHRGLLMVAVMGVSIIQFLDMTIANVALPHMQASLGGTLDTMSWVLTSFIIAGVMATPVVGWISDRFGSRRVFLVAVAGFLLSSMLCGAATSLPQMIVFRCLQGVSAAFIGPMSQTIMYDINPPSKQPAAISLWGAVVMVAPITGPMVGGFLTDVLNWRWVFYINLPIGIPVFLILLWQLPSRPIARRAMDYFGFLALAVGLGAMQLMLDRGQHVDWFQSTEVVVECVVMVSALWIFAVHTLTSQKTLFPAGLLKNRNFVGGVVLMFVLGVANVAIAAILPTMYQTLYGYSPLDTGLLLMPRGIGLILSMQVAIRLMTKIDIRYLVCIGFTIASYALWSMSRWTLDMGHEPILVANFIQGLGLGLVFAPVNIAAFSSLDPDYRPDGSSLLNLMRNIGGSFGIAAIFTLISRNTQTSHADLVGNITQYSLPGLDPLTLSQRAGDAGSAALQMMEGEISRQASMIAYVDNFYLMAAFVFSIGLGIWLFKPIRIHSGADQVS